MAYQNADLVDGLLLGYSPVSSNMAMNNYPFLDDVATKTHHFSGDVPARGLIAKG